MDIHIGSIIKNYVYQKRIKVSDLAQTMKMHPGSMPRVFNYPSMQVSMLKRFSTALQFDFFALYSKDLNLKTDNPTPPPSDTEKLLEQTKAELEKVKQENFYLKQINELLTKK